MRVPLGSAGQAKPHHSHSHNTMGSEHCWADTNAQRRRYYSASGGFKQLLAASCPRGLPPLGPTKSTSDVRAQEAII
eukprot:1246436-Alexandrium_andersonii.AAC.1